MEGEGQGVRRRASELPPPNHGFVWSASSQNAGTSTCLRLDEIGTTSLARLSTGLAPVLFPSYPRGGRRKSGGFKWLLKPCSPPTPGRRGGPPEKEQGL